MLYQTEDCVIHEFEISSEINDDNAIDLSHWNNDDKSITYFIPTIEDEMN